MKKFLRMVSVFALAGATLAYTGCTDYSEDIDKVNDRIDNLETGTLANLQQQITNNGNSIDALNKALAAANTTIENLQKTVDALGDTHAKDVAALNTLISGLKADADKLATRVKTLEEALPTYATKKYVDATFATLEQMKAANTEIASLKTRLEAAEGKLTQIDNRLKAVENKYDSDVKISEILAKIDAAKNAADAAQKAADKAQATADEALGKVNTLTEALGVYAKKGELEAKMELLDSTDTAIKAAVEKNYNEYKDFVDNKFEPKVKELIEDACAEGGTIDKAIAAQVNDAKSEIYNKIAETEKTLNARINKLWNAFNTELRSLVFVPELYVDGIEAIEITGGIFDTYEFVEAEDEVESEESGDVYKLKGIGFKYEDAGNDYLYVPAARAEYEMNPSSAIVTADDELAVVIRKAESIKTNAADTRAIAEGVEGSAKFVNIENGNLYVDLTINADEDAEADGDNDIYVFALQANVKNSEGEDTTVTSDYARLFGSEMSIEGLAFTDAAIGEERCSIAENDHIYSDYADALLDSAQFTVDYKGSKDLTKLVETHYALESESSKAKSGVYEEDYPENDYKLKYEFSLVDYTVNDGTVSESQYATISEDGILTPCGVDENGKATGETSTAAIDKKPLVRVILVSEDGSVLKVGFFKINILPQDYLVADPFKDEIAANDCNTANAEYTDFTSIYAQVGAADAEEFEAQYGLEIEDNGEAVQYEKKNNKFTKAESALGTIEEGEDNCLVARWTAEELAEIYAMEGHTATVYVRYVFNRNTNSGTTQEYEGVYVPITVTVTRNAAGTVGVKISNYWFDNQSKAILNTKVPAAEPGKQLSELWETKINQVWAGNDPKFTVAGATVPEPEYKYYFAPEQPKVNGVQLTVAESKIYSLYGDKKYDVKSNAAISEAETTIFADYSKGIYTNTELKANGVVIATINQETGVVTLENNDTAKELLNCSPSVPKSAAELYANIGVALKNADDDCDLIAGLKDAVNPYYFLRPLNVEPTAVTQHFVDGLDAYKDSTNLYIFDILDFSDWRGEAGKFVTPDYSNLWYFKYYGVNNIKVDVDSITTTLNGGAIGKTKLSEVTKMIEVSHCTGDFKNPKVVTDPNGLSITYKSETTPTWGETQFNGLKGKFGFIHYFNNGTAIDTQFMLRIPITVTYTWGEIHQSVDVIVDRTL